MNRRVCPLACANFLYSFSEITASYYLDGRPREVDDGGRTNTYAYDASGQTVARKDADVVTTTAYNDAGLPDTMASDVVGSGAGPGTTTPRGGPSA